MPRVTVHFLKSIRNQSEIQPRLGRAEPAKQSELSAKNAAKTDGYA